MIDFVRKRKKGLVNFILLGLAVILMVSFGLESLGPTNYSNQFAVKLNGEEIPRMEFDQKLRSVQQLYRNQFGEAFDRIIGSLNLQQRVVDQIIDERILADFFSALGLTASIAQVEERILQLPYFNGKADANSFQAYLRGTGLSEGQLEAGMRKEVIEGEFQNALGQLLAPTEDELKSIQRIQSEQAQFISAKLTVDAFTNQVTTTSEEIEEYYKSHANEFVEAAGAELEFIKLSSALFADKVQLSEEDLKLAYEERVEDFLEPEEAHILKLTFKLEEEKAEGEVTESKLSPNDKKRQLAQTAIDRANGGESFAEIIKSIPEAVVENGGDLGWVKVSSLSEEQQDAIQDLQAGGVSPIVEDAGEIAVLQVKERKPQRTKGFEEVKAQLSQELRTADAPLYLEIESEKLIQDLRDDKTTLDALASKYSVAKSKTEAGSTQHPALKKEALMREEGEFGTLSETDSVTIFQVKKIVPELTKPLEKVRLEIENKLKREKAKALVQSAGEKLITALKEKGATKANFQQLALETKAAVEETELKKRAEFSAPFVDERARVSQLFSLTSSSPILERPITAGDELYVAMLLDKKEGKVENLDSALKELLVKQSKVSGERAVDSLVQVLRKLSSIEVNPEILNTGEL